MSSRTRREFMGFSLAGAAGALAPSWLRAAPRRTLAVDPDLVVLNAKVYTMESAGPSAQAFAVHAGRFVAVGTSSEMRSLAGRRTRVVDAKGMTVLPGFITTTPAAPRCSTRCSSAIHSRWSSSPSRASSTN
jgi:hypothetical protein